MKERLIAAGLVLLLAFALMFLLSSCVSTKDVAKSTEQIMSERIVELTDSSRVLQSEISRLTSEIRELQYSGVVFDVSRCPQIHFPEGIALMNKDSIQRLINDLNNAISQQTNRVSILADGTIQAEGKLKSASVTKDKLIKTVQELQHTIEALRLVKQKEKQTVITKTVTITKHKRTVPLWWLYVICFGLGYFVCYRFNSRIDTFFKTIKLKS